jgi:hypothetical protein
VVLSKKEIKQRYFDKVYKNAPMIECACGCGQMIKSKDKYGRDKKYENGHNGRKYDDPAEHKRAWNHRNRPQRFQSKKKRAHRIKKELIIDAGSKCSLCGLSFDGECTSIFDFHHLDPTTKKFNLNNAAIQRYSISGLKEEAKKCELLCAICHRLVHWDWEVINTADPQDGTDNSDD